ncbi:hypothetical protein [uncultured Parolsenella sp.]|uniref:hypothetical protein n=1 Tax=uncultured Parolsenella sp. TaxID=2083008 RepID=UPI0027DC6016|nr:hypothetical protein [uncultured Parolsenella sp.]
MRRVIRALALLALLELTSLATMVALSQPTGETPMRSVPVVTDKPATEATTHIVIEGALP